MKKVLILGNNGMLGHIVQEYLEEIGYDVAGLNRRNCDFKDFTTLNNEILCYEPDVIINCAGMLITNKNIDDFADMNIVLPRLLTHIAKINDMKLIHISTNCVFKDIGPHMANEEPSIDIGNWYGISKGLGEINEPPNTTIRCSITGPELKENGSGLFNWFINNSPQEVTGFTNAMWNGVSTLQLSKFIDKVIKDNITGIVNYYTKQEENKYEILKMFNELYDLKKDIKRINKEGVHSSLLDGPYFTSKTIKEQFTEMKEWY